MCGVKQFQGSDCCDLYITVPEIIEPYILNDGWNYESQNLFVSCGQQNPEIGG